MIVAAGCIEASPLPSTMSPLSPPATRSVANPSGLFTGSAATMTETAEGALDASAPPITTDACLLDHAPGRADAAPTEGDLTDWSDTFGGRVRICLAAPAELEAEGRAFCTWDERHRAMREASSIPLQLAGTGRAIDGGIALDRLEVFVGLTANGTTSGSWDGVAREDLIRSHDHGQRGIVRFEIPAVIDPEHPPATPPAPLAGLLRWDCLDPAPA
jgi:hypothetical protein